MAKTKAKAVGSDPYKIYDTEMTGTTQSGDKSKATGQAEQMVGGSSTTGAVRNASTRTLAKSIGSDVYKAYDTELTGATQTGDKTKTKDEQIAGGSSSSTPTTGAVINKASWTGVDLTGQTVKPASEMGKSGTSGTGSSGTGSSGTTSAASESARATTADQAYDEAMRTAAASGAIPQNAYAAPAPNAQTDTAAASKAQAEEAAQRLEEQKQNLWDSLEYSYGKKIEQSNKQYNQAKNTADLQAQKRGMGRSSYNQQIMANYDRDAAEAANDIRSEMIADYQNRLVDLEKTNAENDYKERQLAESIRQFNVSTAEGARQFDVGQAENARQFNISSAETQRSNRAQEALSGRQLTETERANLAQEALSGRQLTETERSNLAQEAYNTRALEETIRSNQADEAYNTAYLEETSRHNKAEEDYNLEALEETKRSNEESEKINWASIDAQYGDHSSSSSNSSSSGSSGSNKSTGNGANGENGTGGTERSVYDKFTNWLQTGRWE